MATPVPGPGPARGTADPQALRDDVRRALAGLEETGEDPDGQVRVLEDLHRTLATALATIDTA